VRGSVSEQPTAAEWLVGAVALAVAIAIVVLLALLAGAANVNRSLVTWLAVAAALGGTVAFELGRFGLTTRARHRRTLAEQVMLTDARLELLRQVTEELKDKEQLDSAMGAAIEVRARDRFVAHQRKEIRTRLESLANDVEGLRAQERRLLIDQTESTALIVQVDKLLGDLGVQRRVPSFLDSLLEMGGLFFPLSGVGLSRGTQRLLRELKDLR
jgi:hypothetical protein